MSDRGALVAAYLRNVAYPGAARSKLIARDFGVSPATAKDWLAGRRPTGLYFDAMVERWGDDFLNAIYGRRADGGSPDVEGQLRQLRGDLAAALGGGRLGARRTERAMWLTEEGSLIEAAAGLRECVARFLGASPVAHDLTDYAQQNWGWIAVVACADGTLDVRYAAADVAPAALDRLCELITDRMPPSVVLRTGSDAASAQTKSAAAVIAEIEVDRARRAGSLLSGHPWALDRMNPSELEGSPLAGIVRIAQSAGSASILERARDMAIWDHASVFSVTDDDVFTLWIGTRLFDPTPYIGRSVFDIGDAPYADMIGQLARQQAAEATPMAHHVRAVHRGLAAQYRRVSVVAAKDRRRTLVLSASDSIVVSPEAAPARGAEQP